MAEVETKNGSDSAVAQAPAGAYPRLPEGQNRMKSSPENGHLQVGATDADYVVRSFQNRVYADRKSIARAGTEVGLNPTELASLGSALLFHMESPDESTKLEATRALHRILENNSPFERDQQAKSVHAGLNEGFWKKVLNERRDETFLRVPEVRAAAEEGITALSLAETNRQLRKMTGDTKPERSYEMELRDRWEQVLKHKLHADGSE